MVLDFEIDELSRSIRNVETGEHCPTDVLPVTLDDLQQAVRKKGWKFDWKKEFDITKNVRKLTTKQSPTIIQGLISYTEDDGFLYMDLIESAPHNLGKNKHYEGIAGNLVAYVCMQSFIKGHDGFVCFDAKTQLIEHYKKALGAFRIGSQRMAIETNAAKNLVRQYFPDFKFNN
ncbi:MAG: hypothetical protein LBR10_11665 [Prevotellaceae bacterium]|jgi:hypothetical protein|nr:hypothetical protein [Prevotellaceae bacterium]